MKIAASVIFAAVAVASPAHAGWTGLLVNGSFTTNQTLVTQFTSPKVVGPAVEFSGAMRDAFQQNWTISVDVADTFFTVSFLTPGDPNGNVSSSGLMNISLSGLTAASGLTFTNYTCTPAGFPCTSQNGGPNLASISSTSTTATVGFNFMRSGETYRFDATAVPEPAAWLLMTFGFGLLGMALRRRVRSEVLAA